MMNNTGYNSLAAHINGGGIKELSNRDQGSNNGRVPSIRQSHNQL